MTLIKSISGIRGTIGGTIGDALTPIDIVKFTARHLPVFHTVLLWPEENFALVSPRA